MPLWALPIFLLLVGALIALWRWADRTNRAHGAPGRSEDMDVFRNRGL